MKGTQEEKKKVEKTKKTSKKVLTTREHCDIITKLSQKKTAKRSLKIEQQEISTKQKSKCKSRRRVIYTQQK